MTRFPDDQMLTSVAVALGSNLGDRRAHLDYAVSRLSSLFQDLHASSYFVTAPVGIVGEPSEFLNAAAVGRTELSPRAVLDALLSIEEERGRERPYPSAPRTLDLDLVLVGDRIISEPGLIVPHPRFRERRFVLDPLAEIAAGWRDPVTGKTVAELRLELRTWN